MNAAACASQGVDYVGTSEVKVCDLMGAARLADELNPGARIACCEHFASLFFAHLAVPA